MFALDWHRSDRPGVAADRLAASLGAGTGRAAANDSGDGWSAARLMPFADPRRARGWSAAQADGLIVLFAGYLANARELALALGLPWPASPSPDQLGQLYAKLLRQSGSDETERRAIGEYAAAVIDPARQTLRLVRSPLRAPPLHYHAAEERVVAASVPRAIVAAIGDRPLNPLRMADNAWFNYSTDQNGWYEGIIRLRHGHVLEAGPGGAVLRRYYDAAALPRIHLPRRSDYVEQADALLKEGIAAALDGFSRPALLLSGGLDSSLVAAKALDVLPAPQTLDTFTIVPRAEWDQRVPAGYYGDERPWVAALAARHPRLRPHYIDNANTGFDQGLGELFQLAGMAPINLANFGQYHAPIRAARAAGCDVILTPEWGNHTFSNAGNWAERELFRGLRWRELGALLRADTDDPRAVWRRFVGDCLLTELPPRWWHWQRRMRGEPDTRALSSPLRADYVAANGLDARAAAQGGGIGGVGPRSQAEWLNHELASSFDETADIWQGFEQLYGVPVRDPAAYRPLAEFCFGLPTDMFVHRGERRWLAREMARGVLPEAQRNNPLRGRHNADWLAKLAPHRAALRAELGRLEQVPELADMLDFPRLKAALDAWPDETPLGSAALPLQVALTRGLTTARFINHVAGRNA